MDLEPSLQFHATQANLSLTVNGEGVRTRTINLSVELAGRCDVETSDGRSLSTSHWVVHLVEKDFFSEQAKVEQAIGILLHSPKYQSDAAYLAEACSVYVAVDRTTFVTVYQSLRMGQLPSFIDVSVRGLTYGMDFEGNIKVWDVNGASQLYITDFSIGQSLVSVDPERLEDEIAPTLDLATSVDANAIRQDVTTAIVQMQNKIIAQNRWLVWIGAGILILLTTHFK
jgi:hypothetical protein